MRLRERRGRLRARGRWLVILVAVIALPVLAQGEFDPRELADLVRQGDYAAAYELALSHRDQHEGESEFDLYYGIAALETGHVGEALFALERTVMRRPEHLRARLALARAQLLREEDQRALENLDFIAARQPPPDIRAAADEYRQTILTRADEPLTEIDGYVELGGGYDSNVASEPDRDASDAVDTSLEQPRSGGADLFARFAGQINARSRLTPRATLVFAAGVEARPLASQGSFRSRYWMQRGGVELRGARTRTRLTADLQQYYLGGDLRQKRSGFHAAHAYRLTPASFAEASAHVIRLRDRDDPLQDSTISLLSARTTRAWSSGMRPTTSLSVFMGDERPQDGGRAARALSDRQIRGMSAAIEFSAPPAWRVEGSMQYRRSQYGRSEARFDRKRREDYFQARLGLARESGGWLIGPRLRHSRNEANLDAYDYRRTIVEMRARYGFQ